jgi:putative acetyltransferase
VSTYLPGGSHEARRRTHAQDLNEECARDLILDDDGPVQRRAGKPTGIGKMFLVTRNINKTLIKTLILTYIWEAEPGDEQMTQVLKGTDILYAIGRIDGLAAQLRADIGRATASAGVDVPVAHLPLLVHLGMHGPTPPTVVARALGITHPAVNYLATALKRRGLVAVYKEMRDKRVRVLALTRAGRAAFDQVSPVLDGLSIALRGLRDSDGADIIEAIDGFHSTIAAHGIADRYFDQMTDDDSSDVRILPFARALVPHFRALNREWIEAYFTLESSDHAALDSPEATIIGPGGDIVFVECEGAIVGTCALVFHDASRAELAKMAVSPSAQGRGFGRLLGEAIIARARAAGFDILFLESSTRLLPALSLYANLGFRHVERARSSGYERADVYMELDLNRSA